VHWELTQTLDSIVTECPDLFPLTYEDQTHWVLSCAGRAYYLGSFDGRAFTPQSGPFPMDAGESFYAAQTFDNTAHRRIIMGWMAGSSQAPTDPWRCCQSIPRECFLVETADGLRMGQRPVTELEEVHGLSRSYEAAAGESVTTRTDSHYFDALWTADGRADLSVFVGKDGENRILKEEGGWRLVRSYSCEKYDSEQFLPDGGSTLRILADQSTLELFTESGQVLTTELYPPEAGLPVSLSVETGKSQLKICPLPY